MMLKMAALMKPCRNSIICVTAALMLSLASICTSAQVPGGGVGQSGSVTTNNAACWAGIGLIKDCGVVPGSGTVTSVSVVTANGVSGSVATPTTTPAITLTLGAITPSTVAIGAGTALTSSGPGGALTSAAFATPAALSQVSDTNVTLTLGGTPTTALLQATSITAGWSGTLSVARGGTGDSGTAWTTYSPTATCSTSGTITTDTITGRYKTVGKTVVVQANINISTLGTCLGNLVLTAPTGINSTGAVYPVSAINNTLGTSVPAAVSSGSTGIVFFFASAPAANNYYVAGTYESS